MVDFEAWVMVAMAEKWTERPSAHYVLFVVPVAGAAVAAVAFVGLSQSLHALNDRALQNRNRNRRRYRQC